MSRYGKNPSREYPPRLLAARCLFWAGGVFLLLVSLPLACSFGALKLAFADALSVLGGLITGKAGPEEVLAVTPEGVGQLLDSAALHMIVADLRLPRVLLSLAAGAGLAVAGTVFQGILRNPLADPFTLGVSGGAAFGAALAISLGLTGVAWGFGLPLAAFAGAAASLAAVLALGRMGGGLRQETLILAGVVVSALLAALIALVKALDESSVTGIVFWVMGSFQGRGWAELFLLLPGLLAGSLLALLLARELDMLSLGDMPARHLGLNSSRLRLLLLLGSGAVTASCVAVSGIIGFVGLIVPHLCRMLFGGGHRQLLPAAALCGGLLLLWSDVAARSVLPGGVELPVGVITALLGGPFFCLILGKKQGRPGASPVMPAAPLPEQGAARASAAAKAEATAPCLTRSDPQGKADHLVCDGLYAGYGKKKESNSPDGKFACPVLDGVSFTLRTGEFTALLGPNGSGKSTLLHCLSGVLAPWGGQALVAGEQIGRLPEKRRAMLLAALSQKPEFVPSLPAFSLALMGRYAHTPFLGGYSEEDKSRAMRALEETGVSHLAARNADSLSGGELQRVLLARALAQDAPLLLLDEATAGLDPACQAAVLHSLDRRNRERGLTILMAMHELNLAALYCRRLIFLKNGRIVADGPTERVFAPDILSEVYDVPISVAPHPINKRPQAMMRYSL